MAPGSTSPAQKPASPCTSAPLRSSAALESVRATLRAQVPTLEEDRYFHPDMVTATNLVRSGALAQGLGDLLPTVEPQA